MCASVESEDQRDTQTMATLEPAAENRPFPSTIPVDDQTKLPEQTRAARKKAIHATAEDSEMYYSNLILASLKAALANEATY
ncbi:hypothetical protein GQ600_7878 [Phytophthora cactorum]|nr:hypothetical protein GQ600_7878 [Phytophthora cactorum]